MFKYISSALWTRFEHPLLVSMFIFAGILLGIGAVIEAFGTHELAAAFFGVYAVLVAFIGVIGYVLLFVARYVSVVRDRMLMA